MCGALCDLLAAPCDVSSCRFFTGPWTVTRSPLRVLRQANALPLRPVCLVVSLPR